MSQRNTKKPAKEEPRERGVYRKQELVEYAFFMALPRADRKEYFGFDTDQEFAKKYQLNAGTLSDWKTRSELWEERDKYLVHFKKHTSEIIASLAKRAKRSGDAFHVTQWMKLIEGFKERSGLDITSKGKRVAGFRVVVHHANAQPTPTDDTGE